MFRNTQLSNSVWARHAISCHIAVNHTQLPNLCRLLSAYSQFQSDPFIIARQVRQAIGLPVIGRAFWIEPGLAYLMRTTGP